MKKLWLISLLFVSSFCYAEEIEKFCYTHENIESSPYILWSNDTGSQGASAMLANELKNSEITLSGHWRVSPYDALFSQHKFKVNECIILNPAEKITLNVNQVGQSSKENLGEQELFPVIHFDLDGRRRFGLIQKENINKLEQTAYHRSVAVETVLDYSKDETLTLIYVVCPKDREDVCRLSIKHQGQWVSNDNNDLFELKVLARSNWQDFNFDHTIRLHKNGDTPQGVYRIYASIDWKNRASFGGMRRIDLDARYPALNGHTGYADNNFLMKAILPKEAYQDYWFNEWPLAHSLGRQDLRIHANGPYDIEKCIVTPNTGMTFRPTAGCINTGDVQTTQELWDMLIKLNVFKAEHLNVDPESNQYLWDKSSRYGEVFLVLIDED